MGTLHPRRLFTIATAWLVLAAFVPLAWAQSPKRALSLDDLAKVRTVGDPQRSPDGAWVAYTVGTVDTEKDKLVIYPGQFHGITTPSYVRDRAERRLAWYDKYLEK